MSTLRVTNIEAKKDPSSPLVDEKVKLTNSDGDVLLEVDGKNVGAGETVFVSAGIVTAVGVNATGVVTATAFHGDGASLTGIDATSLKDSEGNIVAQAVGSGLVITGVTTVSNKLMVGDSYISAGNIGLGTTTTAGRDAGIGTAAGSLIFNTTDQIVQYYDGNKWYNQLSNKFSATGGTEIQSGGYKYHVYSSTGPSSFVVSGSTPGTIEFVLVAGGGAGGSYGWSGGGGGAGGIVHGQNYSLGPGTHPISIGAGAAANTSQVQAPAGSDSTFVIDGTTITSKGGGGGGTYLYPGYSAPISAGGPGGSGGGGSGSDNSGDQNNPGPATQPSQNPGVSNITNYGNGGGAYSPHTNGYGGGGGGGAGGAGEAARNSTNFPDGNDGAHGGDGQPFSNFPAPVLAPAIPAPVRSDWTTAVGPTGLFGGGGSATAGAASGPGDTARSPGGGGGAYTNATDNPIADGIANTGGGGGSRGPSPVTRPSGAGGSGILIIRYEG